jgi:hypothetical protein
MNTKLTLNMNFLATEAQRHRVSQSQAVFLCDSCCKQEDRVSVAIELINNNL